MKIKDTKSSAYVPFGSLDAGLCFRDYGSIYMKVGGDALAMDLVAVNLESGELESYKEEDEVTVVDALLTVK